LTVPSGVTGRVPVVLTQGGKDSTAASIEVK